jgi:hypothetical protein
MVISTLKHNYRVIHKLYEDQEFETLLCYEEGRPGRQNNPSGADQGSQRRYRILKLKNKELTYQLVSFFMELMSRTSFTDYYECFSKDGFLHLVFWNSDDPALKDKLEHERCELKERLEIGKKLLERILLMDMPDFILYDALADNGVTVSPAMDLSFNYQLTSLRRYASLGVSDVKQRLLAIFTRLFDYELRKEASVDIEDFITELREEEYKNYFEIYKKYEALYEKLSTGDLIRRIKPNTFLFRLWNRIKGLGKYVKPAVSILLLLLIAGYLIYTIFHKKVDAAAVFNFERIGTVAIEDDVSGQPSK